ncbi:hypothetical protein [Spirosoma gilvum]
MNLRQVTFTASLLLPMLSGCIAADDPLNQTYSELDSLAPLLASKPPVNAVTIQFIKLAIEENNKHGISNEGVTLKELENQGGKLYAQQQANAMVDSMASSSTLK